VKHIKTYKLFENIEAEVQRLFVQKVKGYIEDIFQELEDDGFDVKVDSRWLRTFNTEEHIGYLINIKIASTLGYVRTFLLEDVYEDILTLKSYLEEMGFFIDEIKGWAKVIKDGATILTGPETNFILDDNIDLHESDPEEHKLFDKPLMSLTFTIRKEE
jgi:hypothetical protein